MPQERKNAWVHGDRGIQSAGIGKILREMEHGNVFNLAFGGSVVFHIKIVRDAISQVVKLQGSADFFNHAHNIRNGSVAPKFADRLAGAQHYRTHAARP
jgi:hypothetical protein